MADIRKVGLVGCGIMGLGIAQVCAQAGYETWVLDVKQEFIDRAFGQIEALLQKGVDKSKITLAQKEEVMKNLNGTLRSQDLAECDFIIEAAVEVIETKKEIFRGKSVV